MSLGLVKGIIDGVEEVVNVTWVQPRVLDKGQLNLLHDQLGTWTERYCIFTSDSIMRAFISILCNFSE
jgi:hypothetical protein